MEGDAIIRNKSQQSEEFLVWVSLSIPIIALYQKGNLLLKHQQEIIHSSQTYGLMTHYPGAFLWSLYVGVSLFSRIHVQYWPQNSGIDHIGGCLGRWMREAEPNEFSYWQVHLYCTAFGNMHFFSIFPLCFLLLITWVFIWFVFRSIFTRQPPNIMSYLRHYHPLNVTLTATFSVMYWEEAPFFLLSLSTKTECTSWGAPI